MEVAAALEVASHYFSTHPCGDAATECSVGDTRTPGLDARGCGELESTAKPA